MRRRGPIFGGGIFFIGFIFIGLAANLLSLVMPLLVVGTIAFGIYELIKSSNNKSSKQKEYVPPRTTVYKQDSTNTSVRNGDLNRIDSKLTKYFKNNISLPIVEDIALTTTSGKFTTTDQLYLTYQEEKIMKLVEFKNKYPEVYSQIIALLLEYAKQKDEVTKEKVKEEVKEAKDTSDCANYIDKINRLNKAIPQEEITNGLYLTCDLLKQIDILSETHNDEKKTRKLYDYYLPILVEVLEKYKKLQDAPVHGEEFKNCETQLIKTIVLINEALKAICSSMQEDDYMNINADISTLQSLLQKDGYGDNPLKGDNK